MSDNQKLIDSFSPIYQSFLPSLFQEEIPRERYATCSDCAMCPKPDQPTSPNVNYFSPSTKCCTFFPILPNYLIGELLSDSSPDRKEGRSRIQAMIKNKTGVYPHGIFPPADYFARYAHDQEKGFGKQEDLLCPYYIKEGGLCGVYNSWNAYCSTYFCKQVAGKDGKAFWDTVKEYFIYAENVLSKHALIALGFTPNIALEKDMEFEVNMMKYQLQKSLDKPFTKPDYSKLWGDWEGKEEDLYKSCYDHVKSMPSKTFLEVGGALQDVYLGQIKEALHTMRDPDIPSHLKKNIQTLLLNGQILSMRPSF